MPDPLELLQQLNCLAYEKSEESRRSLLKQITDVFMLSPQEYTDLQRQYFGEIIEIIAYDLEWQIRRELARCIASESHAPKTLVKRLAHDEIPVAQPVLEQSPVLNEQDLVQVSEVRSQDHLLAITNRMDIGTRLAAVLVKRGDERVIQGLAQNQQAKISTHDMEYIAGQAKNCGLLQRALIRRRDIPKKILIDLLEHVSENLRSDLQDRIADSDMRNLDQVIDSMKSDVFESEQSRVERHIDELARSGKLSEQVLIHYVKDEKPLEFMLGLANLLGTDIETTQRMLADKTGEGLSLAVRAVDFSVTSFKEIAMSPMSAVPSDLATVMRLVRLYQRLSKENAQQTIDFALMRKQESTASS